MAMHPLWLFSKSVRRWFSCSVLTPSRSSLVQSHSMMEADLAMITTPGQFIITRRKSDRRRLESISLSSSTQDMPSRRVLWKTSRTDMEAVKNESASRLSAMLPIELNYLLLGYGQSASDLLLVGILTFLQLTVSLNEPR